MSSIRIAVTAASVFCTVMVATPVAAADLTVIASTERRLFAGPR